MNPEIINPFASTERPPEPPESGERTRRDEDEQPTIPRNETPEKTMVPSDEEIDIVEESGVQSIADRERADLPHKLHVAFDAIEKAEKALTEDMTEDQSWEHRYQLGIHRHELENRLHATYRKETNEERKRRREEIEDMLTYLEEVYGNITKAFAPTERIVPKENQANYDAARHRIEEIRQALKSGLEKNQRRQAASLLHDYAKRLSAYQAVNPEDGMERDHVVFELQKLVEELGREDSMNTKALNALDTQVEMARKQVFRQYGKWPEEFDDEDIKATETRHGVLSLTRNAVAALTGEQPEASNDPYQQWSALMEKRQEFQTENDADVPTTKPALSRPPKRKKAA